jgi:hypothetical protein
VVKATRKILLQFEGNRDFRSDWNKYGKYFGTPSLLKAALLANIHMAQASEHRIPVTHINILYQMIGKGYVSHLKNGEQKCLNQTFRR